MIEINKIYNENCLETMAKIPDCFVDLIITSPPYNKAGYEGFIRKRHEKDAWSSRNISYDNDASNDFMPEDEYRLEQICVLNEMQRILKNDGSIFYNHKIRVAQHKASHPIEWILKTNLTFRQQIIWNRKASPAVAPIRFLPTTELIFWLTKTPCQPNFERNKNSLFLGEVWEFSAKPNKNHPAPFPEELPDNILMSVHKNKDFVVYDPYTGTGTTLLSAVKNQVNYLGSEISKKYCELSEKRIDYYLKQQVGKLDI